MLSECAGASRCELTVTTCVIVRECEPGVRRGDRSFLLFDDRGLAADVSGDLVERGFVAGERCLRRRNGGLVVARVERHKRLAGLDDLIIVDKHGSDLARNARGNHRIMDRHVSIVCPYVRAWPEDDVQHDADEDREEEPPASKSGQSGRLPPAPSPRSARMAATTGPGFESRRRSCALPLPPIQLLVLAEQNAWRDCTHRQYQQDDDQKHGQECQNQECIAGRNRNLLFDRVGERIKTVGVRGCPLDNSVDGNCGSGLLPWTTRQRS